MHRSPLFFVILGVLCSCGGGGGGSSPAPAGVQLFNGTYHYAAFRGEAGTPDLAAAIWGTFVGDGTAALTGTGTTNVNENEVVTTGLTNAMLPITIDADRNFGARVGITPLLRGGIRADGAVACWASVSAQPAIYVMGRRSGTWSDASLNGTYHGGGFGHDPTTGTDASTWGTVTFDGAGGLSATLGSNANGATVTGIPVMGASYAVMGDGSMTADLGGDGLTGSILAGGELLILAGGTSTGDEPFVWILVRGGTGLGDSTLSGRYFTVSLRAENTPPPSWISQVLGFDADGMGGLTTLAGTENQDGAPGPLPAGAPAAYTVGGSGLLQLNGGVLEGGVSPSGDFAVVAGGTSSGNPELWFLMR